MNRRWFRAMRSYFTSGVCGMLSLCAVNFAAAYTGVSLGFGWVSGGASTFLGVPGVVCLLPLNALFSAA